MPQIQWYGSYKCAQCTKKYDALNGSENQGSTCPNCGAENMPSLMVCQFYGSLTKIHSIIVIFFTVIYVDKVYIRWKKGEGTKTIGDYCRNKQDGKRTDIKGSTEHQNTIKKICLFYNSFW